MSGVQESLCGLGGGLIQMPSDIKGFDKAQSEYESLCGDEEELKKLREEEEDDPDREWDERE